MADNTCSIEGCENPRLARGWCGKHYKRWSVYGDPLAPRVVPPPRGRNICTIEDCESFVFGRGLCQKHYARWRKYGDPLAPKRKNLGRVYDPPEVRFWRNVVKSGDDSCWEWTGSKHRGYGVIGVNKRQVRAHRFSYALHYGPIPDGLYVCHACDNPGCVNPAHLWLGTNEQNTADKTAKGRQARMYGAASPGAKLTADQVRAIRSDTSHTRRELAAIYGLHYMTIGRIIRRESYPDVQ